MAGTLTLSAYERTVVMAHLEARHAELPRGDSDAFTLHRLLVRIGENRTVTLPMLDAFTMLRALRIRHAKLDSDMMALEERRYRGGHNGQLDAAYRVLDTEATALSDVLRRLWLML